MWDEYKASKMEIVTQVQATWVKSTVRLLSKNLCHKNLCQIKLSRVFFFLVLHTERVNLENKGGKYCNIIYIHNLPALVCRWSFSFLAHQPARMLIWRGSSTIPLVSNWARASQTPPQPLTCPLLFKCLWATTPFKGFFLKMTFSGGVWATHAKLSQKTLICYI